jgi:hypothetical protein
MEDPESHAAGKPGLQPQRKDRHESPSKGHEMSIADSRASGKSNWLARWRERGLRPEKECIYNYVDDDNRRCFTKTRWNLVDLTTGDYRDKTFTYAHWPNPTHYPYKTALGIGPYSRLMFRQRTLRDALWFGWDIYWCEGEKDVIAGISSYGDGESAGRAFTTHHQGNACANAKQIALLAVPSSARIFLVLDNDPVGAYIAWEHAKKLVAAGVSVNRLRFLVSAVRERKADLSDHIANGYRLDELDPVGHRRVQEVHARTAPLMRSGGPRLGSGPWRIDGFENGGWSAEAWSRAVRIGGAA